MSQPNSALAERGNSTLPLRFARGFAGFYAMLFLAWLILTIFEIFRPTWALTRNWSNVVVPTFLFACLATASYLAGRSLGLACLVSGRIPPRGIFVSALIVSASLAAATLAMGGVGYMLRAVPLGAVMLLPVIVFFEILVLSFFAHWAIATFIVSRTGRPA